MKRKFTSCLIGSLMLGASGLAFAWWDGTPTGIPGDLEVAQGAGLAFRVHLSPAVSMCGNTNDWAYLNTTDTNYSTNVAVIMMAKAQGLNATFYTTVDANGYCHIGYVVQH